MVLNILGKVFLIEAFLLLFPMFVGIYYRENSHIDYLIPIMMLLALGLPLVMVKTKDKSIYAKEGFVVVALSWIFMSVFGSLPFILSGAIPSFVNALFETVSGFTTTGSTVLGDVESLSKSILFWRSLTHWIGGMGVLVFILALTSSYSAGTMHVLRAEAPGPSSDRLVSKLSYTARILYGIYAVLTVVEIIMLKLGGMPLFDSIVHSFSTAGTGGFSLKNNSIAGYNSVYIEMVIAVFMFIFAINFNLFYLILIGNLKKALKSEELKTYIILVVTATVAIAVNILSSCVSFWEAIRYSFFQVTSISSTTGFITADFDKWPAFSKAVLVLLMMVGACGGSTGGGIKVSRMVIFIKSAFADVRRLINPKAIITTKYEGKFLSKEVERNVRTYFSIWLLIVVVTTLLLCFDINDFLVNFTASITCIGNIGPGLSNAGLQMVGPTFTFMAYSSFSKVLLSFVMLFGRLEIFPMLILFVPRTWKKL